MKSYTIYLIRHGLTRANQEARYVGHTDLPLSSQGLEGLKAIRRETVYPPVEAVFTSPLKRAADSARILYPEQNPIVIPDLIECSFGEFEMCTAGDLEQNEAFAAWLQGGQDIAPPYGESNGHFAHRVCSAFEKIVEGLIKTGTASSAIIGHAGVLMTILSAYGLPEAPMNQWQMDPGYGYTLRITPGVWSRGNKVEVIDTCPFSMQGD